MRNSPVNKKIKEKEKENFADNHVHNTLRAFDQLPNFFSPQGKRCAFIAFKHGVYELPHELSNDLRLTILGNQEISQKYLHSIE